MAAGEELDLDGPYLLARQERSEQVAANEFTEWLRRVPGKAEPKPKEGGLQLEDAKAARARPGEEPFPTDRAPPAEQSTAGKVMRSVGEIPKQAAGGAIDAARHAGEGFQPMLRQTARGQVPIELAVQALTPFADWLNEHLPDMQVSQAKTTTGRITRSLSEFLTGFIPAMKGLRGLGVTGKVAQPLLASAIADFTVRDPHEKRLSNLWQDMGLPKNLLTDYLAADPTDSAAEGRFKSAAESILTGAMLEGFLHAARAVRASKGVASANAAEAGRAAAKMKYGELTEATAERVLGGSQRPLVESVPRAVLEKVKKGSEAAKGMSADDLIGGRAVVQAGDQSVFINFRRIATPEDVKNVIATTAEKFKGSIAEAQRGTITLKETAKLADDLGMTVPDVLARQRGQALNAEQLVAARKIWAASSERLLETARAAADPNAGPVEQFAFRRMLAAHHAIQAEVLGARTEAARALGSWRIPVGGGIEQARAIQEAVEASGGAGTSAELAKRLVMLGELGDKRAIAKFAEKGWGATTVDAIREAWVNGLLSSPTTHVVNTMSNTAVAFQQIYERGAAARISELRGASDGVAPGEALAMAYGLTQSVKDAFRLSWKALKTGETGASLGKIDLPHRAAISSDALRISSETGLGRAVDYLGTAARIPGRFLGAEDEFFKTIGYRMELHAQALRQATAEGLKGEAMGRRMAQLVLNPPEHLRIAAADSALYNTFTNAPGEIAKVFLSARERVPAISFVLPFVRTPANIVRYTMERTPFAPLMSQFKDAIRAGGPQADIALARMATGTAVMLTALDWADSGFVSGRGPKDAAEREAMQRQGWQPYSIKVGNRWYSYNRTDPMGALLGFSADSAEAIRNGEMNEDDVDEWHEVMAMGIAAVNQTMINKTYLQGLSNLVEVMSDPSRYGERYVSDLVASFTPATALAGAVERSVDPTVREAHGPWQAVQARVPLLSENLPPRRTLWGDEIRTESGLGKGYDFFSPIASRDVKPSAIDKEIMRLAPIGQADNTEGAAPRRIGKRAMFDGVQVNFKDWPEVYDAYTRLAGNELKHPAWKMGAKDYLEAVVSGKHPMSTVYKMRSDEMKLAFISKTINDYRKLAQREILADPEFRGFANYVALLKDDKMQQRLPLVVQ